MWTYSSLFIMISMILFYCFIGLRLPRQPKAARLTSATAWKNFPSFRDPIWDQVLFDGLYWSTCKQARHNITSQRIPHNTSSLLLLSQPPVTTTCWFKWAALRPSIALGKINSALNNTFERLIHQSAFAQELSWGFWWWLFAWLYYN